MSILVKIKIVPASGKQKCILDESENLKCFLKSPPEKGKANQELIKFLSKRLAIPQYKIRIIRGRISRIKELSIDTTLTLERLHSLLTTDQ